MQNIYDYAKVNDWKNATLRLAALRDESKSCRTDVRTERGSRPSRYERRYAGPRRDAKDRQAAMREANQVTLDVADMTAAYS